MRARIAVSALVVLVLPLGGALAQTSVSHRLTESTLNNGGDPAGGTFASSANFRMTLDAIGDAVAASYAGSASWQMGAGFAGNYPPPGEVLNERFTSPTTMVWDAEPSVGSYNVYRGSLGSIAPGFGSCLMPGLLVESMTDVANPASGTGWLYLVTARNSLLEEGTKGYRSSGIERTNPAPCP